MVQGEDEGAWFSTRSQRVTDLQVALGPQPDCPKEVPEKLTQNFQKPGK